VSTSTLPRTLAPTAAVLLAVAAAAWLVTAERMEGMDAGPGTDLGSLGWFVGVWVTMMVAMMLPSALPATLAYARRLRGSPTVLLVVGYFVVWTAFGLAAYGLFRLAQAVDPAWLAWDRAGPYVAGGAIVVAGLYELTPWKRHCLRRCRAASIEPRDAGALRLGVGHGLDCLGCSWGLMTVLFALGVMSIMWMVVVAGVILAEKVLPRGLMLTRIVGPALVALGIWLAVSPGSLPGLTEPSNDPSRQMEMEM
jgi:predicted metal-binding membrane protein